MNANKREERDPVEQLLQRAAPRPAPPAGDERAVRDAVHAEWRRRVHRRRRRQAAVAGLAATLVAAAMLALTLPGSDATAPAVAAHVDKQFGAVYRVPANAGLVELGDAATLRAGQVVQTAKDSGLGLRMNGASVRLDEDSRIELEGDSRLYLQRGRVYVDTADGAGDALVVRTDQGSIVHLGTQYLVAITGDELSVAVREGAVRVDGRYYDASAAAGEQVTLNGTRRPAVNGVPGYGGPWRWTEVLAPRPALDGLPAARFLAWVSDETGYRLAFDDDAAERIATTTVLKGAVDEDPRTALRLRLLTMDLAGDVDEARGEIRIRSTRQ